MNLIDLTTVRLAVNSTSTVNYVGIEAELLPVSFNGTRMFLESMLQLVDKVRVSFVSSDQNSTGLFCVGRGMIYACMYVIQIHVLVVVCLLWVYLCPV